MWLLFEPSDHLVAVRNQRTCAKINDHKTAYLLVSCVWTIVLLPEPHYVPTLGSQQKENHVLKYINYVEITNKTNAALLALRVLSKVPNSWDPYRASC